MNSFLPPSLANSPALDAIDWGSAVLGASGGGQIVTYSFAPAGTAASAADSYWLGQDVTAEYFTAYEKDLFRLVFQLIEDVTELSFRETSYYAAADLRLMADVDEMNPFDLGLMVPPSEIGAGFGVFNVNHWDGAEGALAPGSFHYTTILHEVLHGMGLAHPHDRGGGSGILSGVFGAFDDLGTNGLNQGVYTAMTYNNGLLEAGGRGAETAGLDYGYEVGPMALDIAVLQEKYGANTEYAVEDSNYDLIDENQLGTHWYAIWDAGGWDALRYFGTRDVTLDLRAASLQDAPGGGGYLSAADGIQGGFTIAYGTEIEGALGGSGNDKIIGNDLDNELYGRDGADSIMGGDGEDELSGGKGRDELNGGTGNDFLAGGQGDDLLILGHGADVGVGQAGNDVLFGGRGDDRLKGGGGGDVLNGGGGSDFLKGGTGRDVLNGGKGDDWLFGNRHNDWLEGGGGDDLLNGGGHSDQLSGGGGNDTLKGGAGADVFIFERGDDRDHVLDFNIGRDELHLEAALLAGARNGMAVIDRFGTAQNGDLLLDFGRGDVLLLEDIRPGQFSDVAGQIEIF
ncbi:MAG: M10 family metallopeptidase [Sulfitobacter sp.]